MQAKLVVPPTILWSGSLSIVLALVVLTAVSAQAPGVIVLSLSRIPYSFGYAKMFEIGRASSNAFTLPAVTVSAVTFMGSYSKQISAMSASGLYPKTLSYHYGGEDVPLAALLLGSLITYIILLVFWLIDERWPKYLFGIGLCGSFTVNFSVLMGYIVFHRVYSGLERSYNSPFRIYGAIYGILLFIFGLITVLFFQQDSYFTLYVFLVYLCVMTIYYICKAKRSQYFSQEEQAILLVAYIIKCKFCSRQ